MSNRLAPILIALALTSAPLSAQGAATPATVPRSAGRAELESSAAELERYAASSSYSERTRSQARTRATELRRRLREGDFRTGDRVALRIEGQSALLDTVTVSASRSIVVRGLREVSLQGVLRSELEAKLRTDLTDFVRSATITAEPLMRVAVFGAVTRPGYSSVAEQSTIDQLLSGAGGPTSAADPARMKIMRGEEVVLSPKAVQSAIATGGTLAELGLTDGDAFVVPVQGPPWDRGSTLQIVSLLMTPILAILVARR